MVTLAPPEGKVADTPKLFKGIVQHLGRYALILSCRDLDKKIDTTLVYMWYI